MVEKLVKDGGMKNNERYVVGKYGYTGRGVWYVHDKYNDMAIPDFQVKDIENTITYKDNISIKKFPRVGALDEPLYSLLLEL